MEKVMNGIDARLGSFGILALCFLAAMMEGFDIQAAGVAAPKLAPALGLSPAQMGLFFSSATLGLIFGAIAGGRVADQHGRRTGLAISLAVFGFFSLATAFVDTFTPLVVLRFLTGVGLGGALPNLVAIASEAVSNERRGVAVGIIYAGIPLGGAVASLVSIFGMHDNWQSIFIVGGVLPILLVPLLVWLLPELKVVAPVRGVGTDGANSLKGLFGRDNWHSTLLLWIGFFFGLLVLYLLLNWLPALMVSKGFSKADAGIVQVAFNVAGAAGSLIAGAALDTAHRRLAVLGIFSLLVCSLGFLAVLPVSLLLAVAAGILLGISIIAVQATLYGLAPQTYQATIRGTGVGLAVAVGRLGSIAGPLLAGVLVAGGRSPSEVLLGIIPLALLGGLSSFLLIHTQKKAPEA